MNVAGIYDEVAGTVVCSPEAEHENDPAVATLLDVLDTSALKTESVR
jgi:hypothetical protein